MTSRILLVTVSALLFLLAGCDRSDEQGEVQVRYYTWDGLEPDRWASIWLVNRYLSPGTAVEIVPTGAEVRGATAFGTPVAEYRRTQGRSTFENLVSSFADVQSPVVERMGAIINFIEISPWSASPPEGADVVEHQFRKLQEKYARTDVPHECYQGFFNALYTFLARHEEPMERSALGSALFPEEICNPVSEGMAAVSKRSVETYPLENLLEMLNDNKKVIFVDTREPQEFSENHIPGAVNLQLRHVSAEAARQFQDADLVIGYCVKDFRGYEMARALHDVGVMRVGIMKPYGIRGWMTAGLPIVEGVDGVESDGIRALFECAVSGLCLKKKTPVLN